MYDSLNIIIPVYNEGENIGETIRALRENVKTISRVFIVYDFDEDNTLPAARELTKKYPNISLVKNRYGRGVLNAIKTGFETVADGVILVVMADLSDRLDAVDLMFRKINQGYDIVCGSRYMKGGRQIGGPLLKRMLSRTAGLSLYYLTGIPTHDATNSFKMYTKNVLSAIEIESTGGFEIGMEIVIKAHLMGYRITEIPSVWQDRTKGESKFMLWKWLPKYLHWYLLAVRSRFSGRGRSAK